MPDATPEIVRDDLTFNNLSTVEVLRQTKIPENDPYDLAKRLLKKDDISPFVDTYFSPKKIGDKKTFWVTNVDTNENFLSSARLEYITEHVYYWIEEGITYNYSALKKLGDTFEEQIYPTNREFFGSEWTPGIDNDPRLYILLTSGIGFNLAGYFSSSDSIHPLIHEYSNAHEMFVLNADNIKLDDKFTYGVLAHEFQHMIHWYQDKNEESWLNEGFSELAAYLNGYYLGGFDYYYTTNPDIQLNDWPTDQYKTTPNYGASFLFVNYFLDRFGVDVTKALVSHPDNGLDSVDKIFEGYQILDSQTEKIFRADDFFMDMAIALFLKDSQIADGRFGFNNYSEVPKTKPTEKADVCDGEWQQRTVNQYGVDYIDVSCPGPFYLEFEGSTTVKLLPLTIFSGDYAFWSNKGDHSDMTLTRDFNFINVEGPITMSYWTWYDLEEDYDYLYLEVSEDGVFWDILTTPSGTDLDISGNSYGWAYNGSSNGWIKEAVDLSDYAGKNVKIRFEYVTDAAVNGEGFLIDDISISEINYFSDFEESNDGWQGDGFVRVQNSLPQTYLTSTIDLSEKTSVNDIQLNPDQTFRYESESGSLILVISGSTKYTRQIASYQFRMIPK